MTPATIKAFADEMQRINNGTSTIAEVCRFAKEASFRDRLDAFFDESAKIEHEARKVRDADLEPGTTRPFSTLLVTDDDAIDYRPAPSYFDEPEIILGKRIG